MQDAALPIFRLKADPTARTVMVEEGNVPCSYLLGLCFRRSLGRESGSDNLGCCKDDADIVST